ncbi:MAG: MFS transporter [Rhizobiales bacterium]|nr:MFS transporter [Hyphomicrobiales bacterium]
MGQASDKNKNTAPPENALDQLSQTPDETRASAEAAYEAEIETNLPRNYIANLGHGLLGQTGFRLITAPTFVPAYIYLLSGSEFAVGLALAAQWFGNAASSTFGATLIEHRKRVLPMGLMIGWGMRAGVLGLALSAFFMPPTLALWFAVGFLAMFGFFNGIQGVIFNYLMSKVIPLRLRGRLTGFRNFAAGLTASGVAYVGGHYFVEGKALGNGYATTFLTAFILTSIGLTLLMLVREPEPPSIRARSSYLSRMREVPTMIRQDHALGFFFVAAALAAFSTMAVPFYVIYAGHEIGLSGTTLGVLSTAFLLSQTAMNLFWGWIADRFGNRIVFLMATSLWALATIALMNVSSLLLLSAVFAGLGAGQGGFQNCTQNITLEFGSRDDLPMRIGMLNTAIAFMMGLGPLVGGLIANGASYEWVFSFSVACLMAAIAMIVWKVDEPRHRTKRVA